MAGGSPENVKEDYLGGKWGKGWGANQRHWETPTPKNGNMPATPQSQKVKIRWARSHRSRGNIKRGSMREENDRGNSPP